MPCLLNTDPILVYLNATGVPNVTSVIHVPKMTKNDPSVPVFGSVHFYMDFWKNPFSPLKFNMVNGRHIENCFWP